MKISAYPHFVDRNQSPHAEGKLGVIDIGSSMVRLVVYEDDGGLPHLLLNEKTWVKLGEGKKCKNFAIVQEKIDQTIDVLKEFILSCEELKCTQVVSIATSAVREATNKDDFIHQVEAETGLRIAVISGETEAKLAATGAMASLPNTHGLVVDLGGGSLELCETSGEQRIVSMPKGVLSLQAESNNCPPTSVEILKKEIAKHDWLLSDSFDSIIVLGSGMKTAAELYAEHHGEEIEDFDTYAISRAGGIAFCKELLEGDAYKQITRLPKEWLEVLPYRVVTMLALLESLNVENVRFATFGIREGVYLSQRGQGLLFQE